MAQNTTHIPEPGQLQAQGLAMMPQQWPLTMSPEYSIFAGTNGGTNYLLNSTLNSTLVGLAPPKPKTDLDWLRERVREITDYALRSAA